MSGKSDNAEDAKLPTILPKKVPSPVPSFSKTVIPPSRNSSAPGIKSISPATPTRIRDTPDTTAINSAAPVAAGPAMVPTVPKIAQAPDNASINADIERAVSNGIVIPF